MDIDDADVSMFETISQITGEQAIKKVEWGFRTIAPFGEKEETDEGEHPSGFANVSTGVRLWAKLDGSNRNYGWNSTCDKKMGYVGIGGEKPKSENFFLTPADANFQMPSNLFSYTVRWVDTHSLKGPSKIVVGSTFEPVPLTMKLILESFNRLKMLSPQWANKEAELTTEEYDDIIMQKINIIDLDGTTTCMLESPEDSEIPKPELLKRLIKIGLKDYITTDIVVYSMWEEHCKARFTYGEKFLLSVLMPESLMRLLQIFRDKHFYKLAFRDIVNPEYKGIKYMNEQTEICNIFKFGLHSPILTELRELTYEEIVQLYNAYKCGELPPQMAPVLLYRGMIKRNEETKSTVSFRDQLAADLVGSKIFGKTQIDHSISFLTDNGIVTEQEGAYLLTKDHIDDLAIASVFKYILSRKKKCKGKHDYDLVSICSKLACDVKPPIKICDEQLKVIESLTKVGLVGISGAAGSGKSKLMWLIIKALSQIREMKNEIIKNSGLKVGNPKAEYFLVTSFQSANVIAFRGDDIVCSTIHRFLFLHEKTCPKSPYRSRDTKNECIFENVSSVFIEECSLVIPALLSRILVAVKNCGNLKRVIFCGDKNQNKSIAPGNLIDDLRDVLYTRQLWFDFIHDHRTSKEATILGKISVNIANGLEITADGEYYKEEIIEPLKWNFQPQDLDPIVDSVWKYIQENNISEYSHLIITRENKVREYISDQISYRFAKKRDPTIMPSPCGFYIGSKVVPKGNDHERGLWTNGIGILYRIYDIGFYEAFPNDLYMTPHNVHINVDYYGQPPLVKDRDGMSRIYEIIPLEEMTSHIFGENPKFNDVRKIKAEYEIKNGKVPGPRLVAGSAITINVSQGLGVVDVILIYPYDNNQYDTRNSLYTGVTRAKNRLLIMHTGKNLKQIINRPEKERTTNLVRTIENVMNDLNISPKIEYVEFSLKGRHGQEKKTEVPKKRGFKISALSLLELLGKRKQSSVFKSVDPDANVPNVDENDDEKTSINKKMKMSIEDGKKARNCADILPPEIWETIWLFLANITECKGIVKARSACRLFDSIIKSTNFCSLLADDLIKTFDKEQPPINPPKMIDGILVIPGTKIIYCKSCKSATSVASIMSNTHKVREPYSIDYEILIPPHNDGRVANPTIGCKHYITVTKSIPPKVKVLDTDVEILDLKIFEQGFIDSKKITLKE